MGRESYISTGTSKQKSTLIQQNRKFQYAHAIGSRYTLKKGTGTYRTVSQRSRGILIMYVRTRKYSFKKIRHDFVEQSDL